MARPWSHLGMLWIYCFLLFKDALTYCVWKDFYVWYLAVSIAIPASDQCHFYGLLILSGCFITRNTSFKIFCHMVSLIFLLEHPVCISLILLGFNLPCFYGSESLFSMPLFYKGCSIHLQQPISPLCHMEL